MFGFEDIPAPIKKSAETLKKEIALGALEPSANTKEEEQEQLSKEDKEAQLAYEAEIALIKHWDEKLKEPEFAKFFADFQKKGHRLVGFIIEGWDEKRKKFKYLSHGGTWEEFSDETRREDPKIYQTLNSINRARKRWEELREMERQGSLNYPVDAPDNIGFKLWKHPDAYAKPLEEFLKMSGSQFPGSPSQ